MQKTPLSRIFREELIRATVFGISFFTILSFGFVATAYAANGGMFGAILNKILASGNWESPTEDGTVRNCQKLGNITATGFVVVHPNPANRSCATNKCVIGFEENGTVKCTP